MNSEVFQVGELTAAIGDNSADDDHRAGYNGIWSLTHQSSQRNLFVPAYAGWNLEHIFDGYTNGSAEVFYEPRHVPMTFHRLSESQAKLYQAKSKFINKPAFGVSNLLLIKGNLPKETLEDLPLRIIETGIFSL